MDVAGGGGGLKTTRHLWVTFGLLVGLFFVLLVPVIWTAIDAQGQVTEATTVDRQRTVAAHEMEINLLGYGLAVRRYQVAPDKADLDQAREDAGAVDKALESYRSLERTAEQDALLREFEAIWLAVREVGNRILADPSGAGVVENLALMRKVVKAGEKFLDDKLQPQAAMGYRIARDAAIADIGLIVRLALAMLVLGVGATLGLGVWTGRRILAGEASLIQHATALRELNATLESGVAERTAKLRRSVRELERSNQSLTEFATVAAHDLQTPLRAISNFGGLLREKLQGSLDADSVRQFGHIIEGSARMQALTRDLLIYAKATDAEAIIEEFNLEESLQDAMGTLRDALTALGGSLSHDALPRIQGVRTEIVLVLRNLIGNAIKFHGTEPARVHVSAEQKDGAWRVAVEDNGIGIASRYQERIFQVFRRLHTHERYPGTGIGLALVKRIVEFRGGSVGVDSIPGRGSRFWFTIVNGE